jgi:hypothetical protein
MHELPWFERQLVFDKPKEMLPYYLERLQGTMVRMEEKVKGVSSKVLTTQLHGKWSVQQNIGHLAEVDEIANKRIDEMISGIEVMSPAVFEPRQDYNAMSIQEVLAYFQRRRKENLTKYKSIKDADLLKSSIHPRLKVKMSPVDLAWFDAEHDDHHLVKINEIISTLNKQFGL